MTEIKKWFDRIEWPDLPGRNKVEVAMLTEIAELRSALAQQSMQLAHDSVTIECLNDKVMGLLAQPAREPMSSEQLLQLELSLREYYDSDTYDLSLREFARALLEKAQNKA